MLQCTLQSSSTEIKLYWFEVKFQFGQAKFQIGQGT